MRKRGLALLDIRVDHERLRGWLRTSLRAWLLVLAACLAGSMPLALGQSGAQQAPPAQKPDDNPFPGEPQKDAAKAGQGGQAQKPGQSAPEPAMPSAAKPGGDNDNPFPGESSDAPIIPVDGSGPAGAAGAGNSESGAPAGAGQGDASGDPVKSPDAGGAAADDGFSSSSSGLHARPAEEDGADTAGKGVKKKSREDLLKENVDVGNFYLDRKNWRAAQGRFEDAFALNAESPEAVWGLAEAERHLNLNGKALEHYRLFLSYDPDGPHGKAARRAVEELQAATIGTSTAAGPSAGTISKQK